MSSEDAKIEAMKAGNHFIAELNIDADSLPATSSEIQHERRVAIFDLLEENNFRPIGSASGPYVVTVFLRDASKLILKVQKKKDGEQTDEACSDITMSLMPFRRIIKDYFLICESYHNAIRTATSAQIEAIDMGRRGLHNEGTALLVEALEKQVEIEFNTARRIFTLICSLHRRKT